MEVISRIFKLTKDEMNSKQEANTHVAAELSDFWIYGLNIYLLSLKRIKDKLKGAYEGTGGYQNLKKRGGEAWLKKSKLLMKR